MRANRGIELQTRRKVWFDWKAKWSGVAGEVARPLPPATALLINKLLILCSDTQLSHHCRTTPHLSCGIYLSAMAMRRYGPVAVELLSLTGLIIAGDAIVQRLEYRFDKKTEEPFRVDYSRALGMGLAGFLWVGPLTMTWFPFLHGYMARKMPHLIEGSFRYVFTKMMLENICLAGPCCLGFFVIPSKVEGGDRWITLPERLQSDYIPTLLTDIAFWTIFSPFNYKFAPVKFQPAISCMLGGVEAGGLSYLIHLENPVWKKFL